VKQNESNVRCVSSKQGILPAWCFCIVLTASRSVPSIPNDNTERRTTKCGQGRHGGIHRHKFWSMMFYYLLNLIP